VCVDFLRPRPERPGGLRFLFDCGTFSDAQLAAITLQEDEILDHRFVELSEAKTLLSRPIRRRVMAATTTLGFVYLEDGRPAPAYRRRAPRATEPGSDGCTPPKRGHASIDQAQISAPMRSAVPGRSCTAATLPNGVCDVRDAASSDDGEHLPRTSAVPPASSQSAIASTRG
jgi:hypothetical protein